MVVVIIYLSTLLYFSAFEKMEASTLLGIWEYNKVYKFMYIDFLLCFLH